MALMNVIYYGIVVIFTGIIV